MRIERNANIYIHHSNYTLAHHMYPMKLSVGVQCTPNTVQQTVHVVIDVDFQQSMDSLWMAIKLKLQRIFGKYLERETSIEYFASE